MRRNLYNKKIEDFIQALKNQGWRELTLHRDAAERHLKRTGFHLTERHFRKAPTFHLILKQHGAGYYCVMHQDKFIYHRRIHRRPVTKSDDLVFEYRLLIAEYKHLRS